VAVVDGIRPESRFSRCSPLFFFFFFVFGKVRRSVRVVLVLVLGSFLLRFF
jgi:hypothetical protein